MSASPPRVRRIRIDRLELDLHGIAPATAEAVARALGPALAQALASHPVAASSDGSHDSDRRVRLAKPALRTNGHVGRVAVSEPADGFVGRVSRSEPAAPTHTERVDAGRIETSASPDAHGLATLIAGRLASRIVGRGGSSDPPRRPAQVGYGIGGGDR